MPLVTVKTFLALFFMTFMLHAAMAQESGKGSDQDFDSGPPPPLVKPSESSACWTPSPMLVSLKLPGSR